MRNPQYTTPEYKVWVSLRRRCRDPKSESYAGYGGRGIQPCVGINSDFTYFVIAIGERPLEYEEVSGRAVYSVERIDNNGGYWCGQCSDCIANNRTKNIRWATSKEQANNTRHNVIVEYDGEKRTLAQWSEHLGIAGATLYTRKHRGAKDTKILAPVQPRKKSVFTKDPARPDWVIRKRHRKT